jgi:tRNA A-37 threonylcarbamoyl transferase component Bud32
MPTQVTVIAGPDAGRVFPMTASGVFTIGRGSQSHTRLVDPAVSRLHCEVRVEGNSATVSDARSASGTFVNGQRVTSQPLRPGDVIEIGDTQLRFEQDVAEDTTLVPGALPRLVPATRAVAAPGKPTQAVPPPAVTQVPPKELVFANKPGGRVLPRPLKDIHDLAGKSLGSYQLQEIIGTGTIGVVFKARDAKDLKVVALKVLRADFATNRKALQRFVRGMMAVRNLVHPHIIELHNAGVTGSHAWIAMEYVEGPSAQQLMQESAGSSGRDWRLALRVATHIARALDFMHQRGLVHRGVMPQNILVQARDQTAKLGDATLAKAMEGNASDEVTSSGEFVGNLYYLAPERTLPGTEADGRADIYSLGVSLYALIAGHMPFEGKSMAEVVAKIRHTVPASLRTLQPAMPAAFEAVIAKMLAKRPEDRYATAKALLADLAAIPS